MLCLRKMLKCPKLSDTSPIAQFYYANNALRFVTSQLLKSYNDSSGSADDFTNLVHALRSHQDKVLVLIGRIIEEALPEGGANRDFRVKFPEDVLMDNLYGQLWFGAECLVSGSTSLRCPDHLNNSIRSTASDMLDALQLVRTKIEQQALRNPSKYPEKLKNHLRRFDELFADFEYSYISSLIPIKSLVDLDVQKDVTVLFCETVSRALEKGYLVQEALDDCDPGLMFTIPRLAIVCGLAVFPDGPLSLGKDSRCPGMFTQFVSLLFRIRELLRRLSAYELEVLERSLCNPAEASQLFDRLPDDPRFQLAPSLDFNLHVDLQKAMFAAPISRSIPPYSIGPSIPPYSARGYSFEDSSLACLPGSSASSTIERASLSTNVLLNLTVTVAEVHRPPSSSTGEPLRISVSSQPSPAGSLHSYSPPSSQHSPPSSQRSPHSSQHSLSSSQHSPHSSQHLLPSSQHPPLNSQYSTTAPHQPPPPVPIEHPHPLPTYQHSSDLDPPSLCRSLVLSVVDSVTRPEPPRRPPSYHENETERLEDPPDYTTAVNGGATVWNGLGNPATIDDVPSDPSGSRSLSISTVQSLDSDPSTDPLLHPSHRPDQPATVKDVLHRLFVCISGVADQLQSNYPSDLRVILKEVFAASASRQLRDLTQTPDLSLYSSDVRKHCGISTGLTLSRSSLTGTTKRSPPSLPFLSTSCCSPVSGLLSRSRPRICSNCGTIFYVDVPIYSALLVLCCFAKQGSAISVCNQCCSLLQLRDDSYV